MRQHRIVAVFFLLGLTACTTTNETNPARSATEEMLISTAADRSAAQLALKIPAKTKVFVDAGNFEGTDSKYAIGAMRASLLKQGVYLVDDKKKARIIVEIRSGALSTDKKDMLIGIPGFNIPIPFSGGGLPFPKIALYESDKQQGVAKFAATGYDAKSGALVAAQDPQYGFAHNTKKTILIFFSWTESDALPDADKDAGAPHGDRVTPASTKSGP